PETLQRLLAPETVAGLELLQVFAEIDSTNRYLIEQRAPSPGGFHVVLADYQSAGRGRMGKSWRAPPASSICLSIAYTFQSQPHNLPSLSLATGIAVVEVLRKLAVPDVALKWPNDILVGEAKLGGILIETRAAGIRNPVVVTGLGLNVDLAGADADDLAPDRKAPITDLKRCLDVLPDRATLVASLIDTLCAALRRFDALGFAAFLDQWKDCDWLLGRHTIVETAGGRVSGAADGVDEDGALQIKTGTGRLSVRSGSIVLPAHAGSTT
ncbi:MAG TPA: biotin--[acetyl-CoA-carboxylase] ligase, partial [Woeseiaceae bacterium]|nr:biotin--[acetyl-CoA-carboxylase] ligase [Woeseiaceae bacterium]